MASGRTTQLTQGILNNSSLAVLVEGADPTVKRIKYTDGCYWNVMSNYVRFTVYYDQM
jgi:hypothetical protein